MPNFQEEFAQSIREWSDEELVEKIKSGNLIEIAHQLASEELKIRGIEPPAVIETKYESDLSGDNTRVREFETIAECANVTDALIIQGKLEAEGIPAHIPDSFLGTSNAFLLTGPKFIRVQVDQELVSQAIEVVRAIQQGDYALDNDDEEIKPHAISQKSYMNLEEALSIYAQDAVWIKIWRGLIDKTSRFASFNPFAAVMGITWCFFRKMYFFGILVALADLIALHFIGIWAVIFLVRIPVGLFANIVYFKKAETVVVEVQAAQLSNEQGIHQLKQQGGISMMSAFLGLGINFLLRFSFSML